MSLHLSQHRTCTQDEQRTQIPVTSFTDPQEARFASRGVLARHETQPGGKLTPAFESAYIADAGHQRTGTQRSNSRDLIQTLAQGTLAMPGHNLPLPLADA